MKSSKRRLKSVLYGGLMGAALLGSTAALADGHGWGHREHGHEEGRHGDRDWHDRNRYGGDHYGGGRIVIPVPVPPIPRIFLPPPPRVVLPMPVPVPVVREYTDYARVIDVDPIIRRGRSYDSREDWDDDGDRHRHGRYCGHGDWQNRIEGYRVTYEYRGREYSTIMAYDPGDEVRIRVGRGIEVIE